MPFPVLPMKGYMSVCIVDDANLEHLVKVVSARILQLELYFSLHNYKKLLEGDILKLYKYPLPA